MNFLAKKKNENQKNPSGSIVQIFVFLEENYIGWDCFDQKKIIVGNGKKADLVIEDDEISQVQAFISVIDDRIVISNEGEKGLLKVNNTSVGNSIIGPLDFVRIGRFTLKIKLKYSNSHEEIDKENQKSIVPDENPVIDFEEKNLREKKVAEKEKGEEKEEIPESHEKIEYQIIFESKIMDGFKVSKVKENIKKALNLSEKRIESLFSGERVVLKKKSDLEYAEKLKNLFSQCGAICEIEEIPFEPESEIIEKEINKKIDLPTNKADQTEKLKEDKEPEQSDLKDEVSINETSKEILPLKGFPKGFYSNRADDEDLEDEEEDFPADFSLRDILMEASNPEQEGSKKKILEIIRFRDNQVQEIYHPKKGESIELVKDQNDLLKIDKAKDDLSYLIFNNDFSTDFNKEGLIRIEKYKSLKKLVSKKEYSRAEISGNRETFISKNGYDYLIRYSWPDESYFKEIKKEDKKPFAVTAVKSRTFRYFTKAVIFHMVIMAVLSFTISFPESEKFREPNTHFVVLDTKNIHKPIKPKPKKKPRPKRITPKSKVKTVTKSTERKTASLRKKKTTSKKAKAGGGHKGNLTNRNIKDTGLLSALGMETGVTVKSNKALASVTNIDAVTSTHSDEGKLKVGGLVGSLGDRGIQIPTGDALNTKGSTKILRSAGIGGDGDVAALSSGKTGKRDVAGGVVTAPLTKKVKFRGGGISREAVAKVINSHIDEINYCYESALISNPSLMGKVVFEWKILLDGSVGEVNIKSSTVRSASIHRCIKSSIKSWKFPKPKGSAVVVSYPFVFDVTGF